jgi:hypothetical protein
MGFGDSYYEPEDTYDHLIDAGWWSEDQTKEVCDAIKALASTTIYEGGKKENGISVEFLMRLTLLQSAADLDVPSELTKEADAYFAAKDGSPATEIGGGG